MRQIKFKLWSKRDGWCGGFCVHQSGLISTMINAHIQEPQHMAIADAHWEELTEDGEYVLCQFTGLVDRNGKEIFEGDIVKFGEQLKPREVVWGTVGFSFHDGFSGTLLEACDYGEIIGNIYESPELLPVKE